MELLQLRYFKAVAEAGKISAAAEALYISPPSLSATISRLERELGVRLFDRTNNRISLNAQGKIFLRHVNEVFHSLDSAQTEMLQSLTSQTANIRVAVSYSVPWANLLLAFSEEHPHITISTSTFSVGHPSAVSLSNYYAFLLAGQNDLHSEDLESVPLFADRPLALLRPDHPLANRNSVGPEELYDQLLILPMSASYVNQYIRSLFHAADLPLQNVYECSAAVGMSMAAESRGIALTTEHSVTSNDPNLCHIPVRCGDNAYVQALYWGRSRTLSAEEIIFRDFVLDFYKAAR